MALNTVMPVVTVVLAVLAVVWHQRRTGTSSAPPTSCATARPTWHNGWPKSRVSSASTYP